MRTEIQWLSRDQKAPVASAPSDKSIGISNGMSNGPSAGVPTAAVAQSPKSILKQTGFAIPGILLFAIGLIPVFSSDRIPRTAFSFACLAAVGIFFFADFKLFPRISGIKVLSPQFWNPRERDWQSYTLMGSVCFLIATFLMISISVLSNFYSARMDHSRLLSHGVINQAKILKKCGNTVHGCLAIDYRGTNEKRYQKSISIDQKFYRKLEDGDSITIVYPKGRPMSAQFTEFDFSIWKPSVPRAWGFILMTLLTIAWFPAKSLFLRIRRI